MNHDHNFVAGMPFHLGNAPGGGSGRQSGGSHEMISDGDSVPELGVEASKVTGPSWCEHPDPDVKGTTLVGVNVSRHRLEFSSGCICHHVAIADRFHVLVAVQT